jgi:hypothetical protein
VYTILLVLLILRCQLAMCPSIENRERHPKADFQSGYTRSLPVRSSHLAVLTLAALKFALIGSPRAARRFGPKGFKSRILPYLL